MTFANPSYLWALAGLSIPLAIHLLSRKEGTVIRVGSIRHVEESNTSQFKSIRLNEILLLLLRMLMVVALALFMSGAQCSGIDPEKKLVYAERGINADSLVKKGYELHEIPGGNYWSFAEKLNQSSFETIVISYSRVENFKGERISLRDNVKWITADQPGSTDFQALAWRIGDTVYVRNGKSDQLLTSYTTSQKIPDSIKIVEPHAVSIQTNDKIILAALKVLKTEFHLPITNSQQPVANNQQPIANNQQPITTIQVTPGIGPLIERVSPTEIHINRSLDQDIALNDNLVIELFKVLYPELQKPVSANKDARVLPDEFSFSNNSHVPSSSQTIVTSSIEKYLIALFLLSLTIERFIAIRRNQ